MKAIFHFILGWVFKLIRHTVDDMHVHRLCRPDTTVCIPCPSPSSHPYPSQSLDQHYCCVLHRFRTFHIRQLVYHLPWNPIITMSSNPARLRIFVMVRENLWCFGGTFQALAAASVPVSRPTTRFAFLTKFLSPPFMYIGFACSGHSARFRAALKLSVTTTFSYVTN